MNILEDLFLGFLISAVVAGIFYWVVILAKMYVAWEACAAAGGIK